MIVTYVVSGFGCWRDGWVDCGGGLVLGLLECCECGDSRACDVGGWVVVLFGLIVLLVCRAGFLVGDCCGW